MKFQYTEPNELGYIPSAKIAGSDLSEHLNSRRGKYDSYMDHGEDGCSVKTDDVLISVAQAKQILSVSKVRTCHRCHSLKTKGIELFRVFPGDIEKFFDKIKRKTTGVVVVVLDIFDFPSSFVAELQKYVGSEKPLVIVANKVDTLPKDVDLTKIRRWLYDQLQLMGLKSVDEKSIQLVSTKTGYGIKSLIGSINRKRTSQMDDIYLTGCTNVGKSSLIAALLEASKKSCRITISHSPGTTVEMIRIPLRDLGAIWPDTGMEPGKAHLIDTPGIRNSNSILNLLSMEELRRVLPKTNVRAANFVFSPGKTVFIGGLARIDFVKGSRDAVLTICRSGLINIHYTSTTKAEEVYKKNVLKTKLLEPPLSTRDEKWRGLLHFVDFLLVGSCKGQTKHDIAIPGLGWISLSGNFGEGTLRIWTPEGVTPLLRSNALLPEEYKKGRMKLTK